MTARELALQILALPEDQQALQVYRGDADWEIVHIKEIKVQDAHIWTDTARLHVDYEPFDTSDPEEFKVQVLRLQ